LKGFSLRKTFLGAALAGALFLSATPAFAQPGGPASPCTRAQLLQSAEGYIQAQRTADPSTIPFGGEWITFNENFELSSMGGGMLGKALKIDYYRTLVVDEPSCATFTEVVVTDPAHPYVLGVLLQGRGAGKVSTVDMLVTDKGDWLFNAANTAKYAKAEDWGVIPADQRDSANTIMAAANAYLDSFDNKSVVVPWGKPCARLEGGLYTAKGAPGVVSAEDTCNVGVPSGVKLINRRHYVDEVRGTDTVLLNFGEKQRPDAHTFRIEKGKIRYVHTITVCKEDACGFKYDDATKKALGLTN
jgi:hypothetical protein